MRKKKIGELPTKEIQEITDNAIPVTTNLCVHEDNRNNSNVYFNVTEWLATPGGTKISKPIEMSKEELNVFLKRFCTSAGKKDGTLSVYKSSSKKSIRKPPLIVSFANCRSTNRFLSFFLSFFLFF